MKKFFIIAAVVGAAVLSVIKATDINENHKMSDLQMENVEALAVDGEVTIGWICYQITPTWCCYPDHVALPGCFKHNFTY